MPETVIDNETSEFERLVKIIAGALAKTPPDAQLFSAEVMTMLKGLRTPRSDKLESTDQQERAQALAEAILAEEERQRQRSRTQFVFELHA